jgi:hypothetical protein
VKEASAKASFGDSAVCALRAHQVASLEVGARAAVASMNAGETGGFVGRRVGFDELRKTMGWQCQGTQVASFNARRRA